MSTHYDAVVIGSGQGGTPLVKAFAEAGFRTALIERAYVGGSCVNVGCTPTKTMIASGRAAYLARRGRDYGIQLDNGEATANAVRVNMEKVRQRKRDIVDSFRSGGERRLASSTVELIRGSAGFQDASTLNVQSADGTTRTLTADRIFINTGGRPAVPHLDGLDDISNGAVLDSTSIQELGIVPTHLVVVGGGYIGLEFGQLFRRLGAMVTVVQRGPRLLPREDHEITDAMLAILREDGIDVRLNTSPVKIRPGDDAHGVVLNVKTDETIEELHASHVLFATGRTPNTDDLDAAKAGVQLTPRGHIQVNSRLETLVPHIWAMGDVRGGPEFTHVSYDDFRILKANVLQPLLDTSSTAETKPSRWTTDRPLAYVVYTDPQLGHVGLHLDEARMAYPQAKLLTASMPMSYVARALETDETRGLMKAVVHADTKKILGFTCLGIEGGELMSLVQTAILGNLPYMTLQDAMFSHPTIAESLNNLWGYLKEAK